MKQLVCLSVLLMSFLCFLNLNGKTVKLTVMSKGNDVPLMAEANVESKEGVIGKFRCDRNGSVSIEIPDGKTGVSIEIVLENYMPLYIPVADGDGNVNMGKVELQARPKELKEVVVNADGIVYKAGTTIVVPSETEKKRNFNAANLLNDIQYKIPGMEYNTFLRSISMYGEQPAFLINGRRQPIDRLVDLSPERIEKIEVTSYKDMKYDAPVFNIILKKAESGGSVSAYTQEGLTTPKNYTKAAVNYNYGKSEFLLDYKLIYRYSTKEYNNEWNEYIAPDYTIKQTMTGLPSLTNDQNHQFRLDYAYIPGKNTILAVTGDYTIHRQTNTDVFDNRQTVNGTETGYTSHKYNHYLQNPWSLTAYFRQGLGSHTVELNGSVARNHGDYKRDLKYSDGYNNLTLTDNSGISSAFDVTYTYDINRKMKVEACAYYRYQKSESEISQNGGETVLTDTRRHRTLLYGKYSLDLPNTYLSLYAGGSFYRDISTVTDNYHTYTVQANVSQRIMRGLSMNYSFSIEPKLPTLADYSSVRQTLNDFSIQTGNPDLRSSIIQKHGLNIAYNFKKFKANGWANIRHFTRPILTQWEYSEADNVFVKTLGNGKNFNILNTGLSLTVGNLFNKLTVTAKMRYDRAWGENQDMKFNKDFISCIIDCNAYFGMLNVGFSYQPSRGLQPRMGMMYSRDTAYNNLYANYRYRNFEFGAVWQFPLTRRACFQEFHTISPIAPSYSDYSINDFNNLLLLSVQYRVNFGKKTRKHNINFQRTGTETDVITEY